LGVEDKHRMVQDVATQQKDRLRQYLRSRVRNSSDIPDIIQEVFLRLLRVPSHESIRMPERYVYTIARHVAMQHNLRSSSPEQTGTVEQELSEIPSGSDVDPALAVDAEECLRTLNAAMEDMSPKVQATFLLSRRDGLSVDEISARLGVSRPMTKKYLVKALAQCRRRLKLSE
jgi:RNA polymerase sigma factor (sigma-70 family)